MGLKAVSRTIAGAADYETGSWTPVLEGSTVAGTQGYAVQVGRYVRSGNLVWITAALSLSSFDASTAGSMVVRGLPHQASGIVGLSATLAVGNFNSIVLNTGSGYSFPLFEVQQGADFITLSESGNNVVPIALTESDFSNTSAFRAVGVYSTGLA